MSGQTFYHTLDGEPPHGGLPPQFNHYTPAPFSSSARAAQIPTVASSPFFASTQCQIPTPAPAQTPAPIQFKFPWLQSILPISAQSPTPASAPSHIPAAEPQRIFLVQPPQPEPKVENTPKIIFMQQPAGAPTPTPAIPTVQIVQCDIPVCAAPSKSVPPPPPPQTSQIAIKNPAAAPVHRSSFPKGWIIIHRVSTISEVTAASGGWDTIPTDRFHWRAWAVPPTCTVIQMLEQLNYGQDKKVVSMHEIGDGGWVEGRTFGKNDQRTLKELGYEGAGWAMDGEEGGQGGGRRALWVYAAKAEDE